MSGKFYSATVKKKAKQLRRQRKTYSEITKQLGIPKSTLSGWFGERLGVSFTMDREAQLAHLRRIRLLAVKVVKDKFAKLRALEDKEVAEAVRREIRKFPKNNLAVYKSLLSMLYWAEGSKHEKMSGLKFANTDPDLMLLYLTLLRKCYDMDEAGFRVRLHVHYYHSIKETKKYWSKLLNIPLSQFNKVYIKKRSKTKKFRRNFIGICFLYHRGSNIRKELMGLALALQRDITKAFN